MHEINEKQALRVLVIAEAANSQWASVPLVGWSLANALHDIMNAHIITQIRNRQSFLDNGYVENRDFTAIDSEKVAKPIWRISSFLSGGEGKGWTTSMAFSLISYYYFEHLVWKQFKEKIRNGEYDIIHRITPLTPTLPSLLAKKCKKTGVPFVLGPLNGGVPWPKGFDSSRRKELEWLSYIRDVYKLVPGYKSTLKYSDALLFGSQYSLSQIPAKYSRKCVYIPENAVTPGLFNKRARRADSSVLYGCFVGRLVPYKGADMLLEAALPLLRERRMVLDIVGDGPMMQSLKDFVSSNDISGQVCLHGWVDHSVVQEVMCKSNILAFPSIREFGGGVVLEAMALGLVPVVIDYAGPGDLVDDEVGIKVPIGERPSIIAGYRSVFIRILGGEYNLEKLAEQSVKRVMEYYTWAAKADQVHGVYKWVLGRGGDKPDPFMKTAPKK